MSAPAPFRGLPVLLVDDELNTIRVLKLALKDSFDIEGTHSPFEALAFAERKRVALLLTDQRMPGMAGHELARKIGELHPESERIVVTGFEYSPELEEACARGDVACVLRKPVPLATLETVLREGLERVAARWRALGRTP
jgi:DNA-binding NtrC family response regulator